MTLDQRRDQREEVRHQIDEHHDAIAHAYRLLNAGQYDAFDEIEELRANLRLLNEEAFTLAVSGVTPRPFFDFEKRSK